MHALEGYDAAALAAAGLIIDCPDLPFPSMPAPPYNPVRGANWSLDQAYIIASPGYFTGPRALTWMNYLLKRDGIAWMSLTPGEVESQAPHVAAARGTVVVCGLGMGVVAYAMSARQAVERVVVVERDPEVIAMFHAFSNFEHWPQRTKVEIVQSDACTFRMDGVDFLYADIWPYYRMDTMLPDMRRMHANMPAPLCGYWGQELDMVDWATARGVPLELFGPEHIAAFRAESGLPLLVPDVPDYAGLCRRASVNPAIRSVRVPI